MEETKKSKKKIKKFRTEKGRFTLTKNPYKITGQELSELAKEEYKTTEEELYQFSRGQSERGIRTAFNAITNLAAKERGEEKG